MLQLLKFVAALLAGCLIGLLIAYAGLAIFKGLSPGEFIEKFAVVDVGETIRAVLIIGAATLIAFYLQIILHEGGHLVCGLATGYHFVSFRIFSFTLIRIEGKLRIKRFSVAGTGGQCLLAPPDRPLEDIPTQWYNLGGVLSNLLFSTLAVALWWFVEGLPTFVEAFLIMFACVGFAFALLNGIPMSSVGISNDGENARLLMKDPRSKQAIVNQLRTYALVQEGVRPKDLPEELLQADGDIDYKNALLVACRIMYAGVLQDREQWQEAYDVLEDLEAHKSEIMGLYVKELESELMFLAWVTGRPERAEQLCTAELMAYIESTKKVMSSKQRVLCAKALYHDKDAAQAKAIYEMVFSRRNDYVMQGEVRSDIALMQSFLTREGVLPETTSK